MRLRDSALLALVASLPAAVHAQVEPPGSVHGKEFSNDQDEDFTGFPDPLNNLFWDNPLAPVDAFDYSGSGPPPVDPDQVDALANHQDELYFELVAGTTPLIVSFHTTPPVFTGDDLYYHDVTGATGIWALGPVDIDVPVPPDDVDAVELWGLPVVGQQHLPPGGGSFDANNYSYIGDCILPGPPAPPGTPRISVFYYDPSVHVSSIYITHDELRNALVQASQADPNMPPVDPERLIDVDGLMVFDALGNGRWEDGDRIVFSLWPTADTIQICNPGGMLPPFPFDGGEIWTWERNVVLANGPDGIPGTPDDDLNYLPRYLVHGGRTWDTANPVGTIFGVPTENIDALEAVHREFGTSFCDGAFGDLAFCPCGNVGTLSSGCDIAQATGGVMAVVTAQNTGAMQATITGTGYPPALSPTAVLIRGNNLEPVPVVFGDGIRCVGLVGFVRLAATAASGGTSVHAFGHGAGPGAFHYQIWFRNNPASFCDPAAAFNLSNGQTLVW